MAGIYRSAAEPPPPTCAPGARGTRMPALMVKPRRDQGNPARPKALAEGKFLIIAGLVRSPMAR